MILLSGCGTILLFVEPVSAYKLELPPYRGLSMQFIGTISESYSTNVTFASDEEEKIDAFVTNISGGFDIRYDGKRRGIALTGRMNRQYHTKNFSSINPSDNLNIQYYDELSAYDKLFFSDTFHRTNTPLNFGTDFLSADCQNLLRENDIDEVLSNPLCSQFAEEFGRFVGNFESYQNNFNVNYNRSISQYVSINMTYGNGLSWSSRQDLNDSILHRIGFGTNYAYSPVTNFNIFYNYAIRNFEGSGDVSTHSPTIGVRKYLTKRLVFIGDIGINISTLSNNETSTSRNILASLSHDISEKTSTSIRYQGNDSINSDKEDVFRNWRITGTITSQLYENINSSLECFYGEGEFIALDVTDMFLAATARLSYKIWEHRSGANISGSLGYSLSDLSSTDDNRGYTRTTINGGITAGF